MNYESVPLGHSQLRYMTKYHTAEEAVKGAGYFQGAFSEVVAKLPKEDDTFIAVYKEQGVNKGIVSLKGKVDHVPFIAGKPNNMAAVLTQIGEYLREKFDLTARDIARKARWDKKRREESGS